MMGNSLDPGEGGEGGTNEWSGFEYSSPVHGSNDLWLELVSKTNDTGCFVIHPPEVEAMDGVYDLFTTTNLTELVPGLNVTNWQWLVRCEPGQTNLTVGNLADAQAFFMLGLTNSADSDSLSDAFEKLVSHSDPNDSDTDGDGLPDDWEWNNFGGFQQTGNEDYDGDGLIDVYELYFGYDPNKIRFFIDITNQFVQVSSVELQVTVTAGVPSSMALLVNSTNLAEASWQSYFSNPTVLLGLTNGDYSVRVGLRGRLPTSQQTWREIAVTLDTVPPAIAITNPSAPAGSRALVQLQGYSDEPLSNVSFDITNAAGSLTNQPGFVTYQIYDTNSLKFTTNYFQGFDLRLTNGANDITLRATDLAGNVTETNLTLMLTNGGTAPMISLSWPRNETKIGGDSFTLTGLLNDPSATITAILVQTNGTTNQVEGIVGRSGRFWLENVPLGGGTNQLALTAMDPWGNSSTTNISVIQSGIMLTATPLTQTQLTNFTAKVSGTISDPSLRVWVGGTAAVVTNDGTWNADTVPVNHGGNNTLLIKAIPSGSNPLTTPGLAEIQLAQDTPPMVQVSGYHRVNSFYSFSGGANPVGQDFLEKIGWYEKSGGSLTNYSFVISPFVTNECAGSAALPAELGESYEFVDCGGPHQRVLGFPAQHFVFDQVAFFPSWTHEVESAQTVLKTGDKDIPGEMNLYRVRLRVLDDNGDPAAPSRVRVPGQQLTPSAEDPNVGEYFVAAPAGASFENTPQVPSSPQYSAWSGQVEKLNVKILANGIDPSTNTPEFCVGQAVTNEITFDPPLPTNAIVTYKWIHSLDYVNTNVPAVDTNHSSTYTTDRNLKTKSVTKLWWIDGGLKLVGCEVKVDTGGGSAMVTPHAYVSVYRPQIVGFSTTNYFPITVGILDGDPFLQLGQQSGSDIVNDMRYTVTIRSKYSGRADITQKIKSDRSNGGNPPDTTSGAHWLDTATFYLSKSEATLQVPVSTNSDTSVFFSDGPGYQCKHGLYGDTTTVIDYFVDYLMFKPSGNTSIPVCLGTNSWNWSGSTTYSSGAWQTPSGSVPQPTSFSPTSRYPDWSNVWRR